MTSGSQQPSVVNEFRDGKYSWFSVVYNSAFRTSAALATVTIVIGFLTGLIVPAQIRLSASIVRQVSSGSDLGSSVLLAVVLVLAATIAFGQVARRMQYFFAEHLGERVNDSLSAAMMRGLTHMSAADHANSDLRDTVARAKGAAGIRPKLLIVGSLSTLFGIVLVGGSFSSLVVASPAAAGLVVLGAIPFLIAQRRIARASWELTADTTSVVRRQEYLSGLLMDPYSADEVRANGTGSWVVEKWLKFARTVASGREAESVRARRLIVVSASASILPFSAALVVGVHHASSSGSANAAGAATLILASMTAVIGELFVLSTSISQVLAQKPFLSAVAEVLQRWGPTAAAPVQDRSVGPREVAYADGSPVIRMRDVSFTYAGAAFETLHKISLDVRCGERIALVGPSGSGKTTLLKTLLGFYAPNDGAVEICDPRGISSPSRDGLFGVLFQDFVQYSLTVREAVIAGVGRDASTDDQVWAALQSAGAADFVRRLSGCLDAELGIGFPGSANLSRGQWQRIALARLYMRDSPIWLLDEPTAALDPDTEEQVFRTLLADNGARTVIFVTHRPWTLRMAHRIVLLQNGRIVDQGSHDELQSSSPAYQQLLSYQDDTSNTRTEAL